MGGIKQRLTSWPTTGFGAAAAAMIALQGALGCERSFMDISVWGPAVAMAIMGALMKGSATPAAPEESK